MFQPRIESIYFPESPLLKANILYSLADNCLFILDLLVKEDLKADIWDLLNGWMEDRWNNGEWEWNCWILNILLLVLNSVN